MPDTRLDEPKGEEVETPQTRFPSVYTNATNMAFGIFDFRILFAEQRLVAINQVVTRPLLEVVMSPQHMKEFAKRMSEKVADYEQMFGPIPVDPTSDTEGEQQNEAETKNEVSPGSSVG
ncbi:MAG TPA: DUF3467 domain-containing protein [Gemmatimonadaceae bacterium]